jgi:hypothetical protein
MAAAVLFDGDSKLEDVNQRIKITAKTTSSGLGTRRPGLHDGLFKARKGKKDSSAATK